MRPRFGAMVLGTVGVEAGADGCSPCLYGVPRKGEMGFGGGWWEPEHIPIGIT